MKYQTVLLCHFLSRPPSSPPPPHLWHAADKDGTSECLMNKAGVTERQMLRVCKVLCLLHYKAVLISSRTHTESVNDYRSQTGQKVTLLGERIHSNTVDI